MPQKTWKYYIVQNIRESIKKPITTANLAVTVQHLTDSLQEFKRKDVNQNALEELLDHLDFAKDCLTMTDEELVEFELEKVAIPGLINDYLREFWDFCDENSIFVSL
jgi:hypothetical protein